MKGKDLAGLIVALATLLGAVAGLYEKVRAADKDRAFGWDAYGQQVEEVERLKERMRLVEAQCGLSTPQPVVRFEGNTVTVPGGTGIQVGDQIHRR